jgi:hypothetical protein
MPRNEIESKSTASENELKIIGKDEKTGDVMVKHCQTGNICAIRDAFADICFRIDTEYSVLLGI